MTFINYESSGNPPSRQKKRVTVHVPSLKWSAGKGLYYHALMDRPDHLNELAIQLISQAGRKRHGVTRKRSLNARLMCRGWLSKATAQTIDWENVAL
jgi:hypothetical protein